MMEREISIVLRLENSYAYGWFEEKMQGKERLKKEPLKIDAQDQFSWNDEILERIFTIYQINREEDICRILLCADRELTEDLFPSVQKKWEWELEEISEAFSALRPLEWYLNGQALKGRYKKIFPVTNGKGEPVYLYTYPEFVLPKQSESHTPLHKIVRETYPCDTAEKMHPQS